MVKLPFTVVKIFTRNEDDAPSNCQLGAKLEIFVWGYNYAM